jgi:hypothetical protein
MDQAQPSGWIVRDRNADDGNERDQGPKQRRHAAEPSVSALQGDIPQRNVQDQQQDLRSQPRIDERVLPQDECQQYG